MPKPPEIDDDFLELELDPDGAWENFCRFWCNEAGKDYHRMDGPAYEFPITGFKEYWIKGKRPEDA